MDTLSRRIYLPLNNELTTDQSQAASAFARFIRTGEQPVKGTVEVGRTNPETVAGEMLRGDEIMLGDPVVQDRIGRVLGALGLRIVGNQEA